MPKYNLSELTEFSKALVYGFEPEGSPFALHGSTLIKDTLYYQVSQHVDVLDGYLFAQNTVLPQLKLGLDKVTPAQIIEWIKAIHKRIGKNLLEIFDEPSGEFCQKTVMHWESSGQILEPILVFLSGHLRISLSDFAEQCAADLPIKKDELIAFMTLLDKLSTDASIELSPMQKGSINEASPYVRGSITLAKLQAVYHSDKLSPADKETVDRIVRVCLPPEKMPAAMQAYSERFVADLAKIDPENIDNVADFIAEKFFELTFTHPFANANGRTATCFINLFLRAFGYPSILLRYPSERDDADSSYSKAFAEVNKNRDLLKAHIKQRILDETSHPYVSAALEKVIELRVGVLTLYKRIQANHPAFDLDGAHNQAMNAVPSFLLASLDETQQSTLILQCIMASMGKIELLLDAEKAKKMESTPANIIAKLTEISGQANWKSYKGNTVYLLENPSEALMKEIALKLKATGAMKITETKRADNKMPVLKIEELNGKKLLAFTSADSSTKLVSAASEDDEKSLAFK